MRLKVDKETDTLYLRLNESKVVESEEVRPGVILDFDSEGRVVGVEFLKISSPCRPGRAFLSTVPIGVKSPVL